MRLRRLDLVRYGKFTDTCIDFGTAPEHRADLHVVYGPNEAGKSTAFAAFLDLLFGIDEARKPGYGYLHRPASLRIGAALDLGDGPREVVRLFRQPLFDQHERPMSDSSFADALAGLSRSSYQTMFSLDDDTLEAGGKSIIASDGDLGQLLFSASAGLSGFSRNLATLRTEADAFFKTGGRAQALNEFKKKLKDLKQRKEQVDTLASAYGQLTTKRDQTRAAYEQAFSERGVMQFELEDLRRRLSALPKMAELIATQDALGLIPSGPPVPAGWDDVLQKLQMADVELRTRLEGIDGELLRLRGDLIAIAEDDGSTAQVGALEHLAPLRVRHIGATNDLPDRRMRLRDADAEVSRLQKQLGAPDGLQPSELLLNVRAVGRLRELIESRSGIDVALAAARSEDAKAASRVAELTGRASPNSGVAADRKRKIAHLKTAITVAEGGDQTQRARVAQKSRSTEAATLASRLAELKPWTGDAETLAQMVVPATADIERFKALIADAETASSRHREERDRLTKDLRRAEAESAVITSLGGPPDDEAAKTARHARDEAWMAHRAEMNATTAVAFEQALHVDDGVGTQRLASFGEVVRLREMQRASQLLNADLAATEDRLRRADADITALKTRWRDVLDKVSPLLITLTLAQFEAWSVRRDRTLEAFSALRTADAEFNDAAEDDHAARIALATALRGATPGDVSADNLADLLRLSRDELNALEAGLASESQLAEACAVLETRRTTLQAASAAANAWDEAWGLAQSGTWLASCEPPADVPTIREILAVLDKLGPAIDKRDGFADRIAKMESDQSAFTVGIHAVAVTMGIAVVARDAVSLADDVDGRIRTAEADRCARAVKIKEIGDAERRQIETSEALATHQQRCLEMFAYFGVTTLIAVGEAIRSALRREGLSARCEELKRSILEELGVASLKAATASLAACDPATLQHSLSELEPRYEDQDQIVRESFAAMRGASDALDAVGGDDAPARLEEEKRTVLLEIEDGALRYLALRAGILATETALQHYRERHRSSMMARAGAAFETISGGAYTGLAATVTKDVETLVGMVAGGGSKLSAEMSKGTRFQLYLALRVAGYHEFVRRRPAVPFIADDIMETFDNARAEQAFRLLATMAEGGQVIYLTHHPHLCEIAKRACPGVAIHDLSDLETAQWADKQQRLSA